MDPDAALDELLRLVDLMAGEADADIGQRISRHEILRMTELVEALDSWAHRRRLPTAALEISEPAKRMSPCHRPVSGRWRRLRSDGA